MWRPSRVLCLEVVQVHEGGLGEVVVGELQVAEFCCHDGLRAG
jgi:ATP-dependent Clp protease adapter protein ClpS